VKRKKWRTSGSLKKIVDVTKSGASCLCDRDVTKKAARIINNCKRRQGKGRYLEKMARSKLNGLVCASVIKSFDY
jgi:hypothetical protein